MTPALNISSTPQSRAQQELRSVNLQLLWIIEHAHCWHDVSKTADAMFHARLIWQSTYGELFEKKAEAAGSDAASHRPEEK